MKDKKHGYNKAMTLAISRKLKELNAQPKSNAINAVKKMRGKWYTGFLLVDTIRKNMDIGLDDGHISARSFLIGLRMSSCRNSTMKAPHEAMAYELERLFKASTQRASVHTPPQEMVSVISELFITLLF